MHFENYKLRVNNVQGGDLPLVGYALIYLCQGMLDLRKFWFNSCDWWAEIPSGVTA